MTENPSASDTLNGMPRWVKVSVALATVVLLLVVVGAVLGGGHGPGRHLGSEDKHPAGHTPPAEHAP